MRKYFHPQASFGCSLNIHTKEVLFGGLEVEIFIVQLCCLALYQWIAEKYKIQNAEHFIHPITGNYSVILNRLARGEFHNFATRSGFSRGVTVTSCWAQNGSTQGLDYATLNVDFNKHEKSSEIE